jgi:hypothetical protein
MVVLCGVPKRRWTFDRPGGKRPSRDMAKRMRGWARIRTSRTLVMPATAPTLTMAEAQGILSWLRTRATGSGTPSCW